MSDRKQEGRSEAEDKGKRPRSPTPEQTEEQVKASNLASFILESQSDEFIATFLEIQERVGDRDAAEKIWKLAKTKLSEAKHQFVSTQKSFETATERVQSLRNKLKELCTEHSWALEQVKKFWEHENGPHTIKHSCLVWEKVCDICGKRETATRDEIPESKDTEKRESLKRACKVKEEKGGASGGQLP